MTAVRACVSLALLASLALAPHGARAAECFTLAVDVDAGGFPEEVSWGLDGESNPTSACLEPGTWTLTAYDAFGDGWDSGSVSVGGSAATSIPDGLEAEVPVVVDANGSVALGSPSVTVGSAGTTALLTYDTPTIGELSTAVLSFSLSATPVPVGGAVELRLGDAFCHSSGDVDAAGASVTNMDGELRVSAAGSTVTFQRHTDAAEAAAGTKVRIGFGSLVVPLDQTLSSLSATLQVVGDATLHAVAFGGALEAGTRTFNGVDETFLTIDDAANWEGGLVPAAGYRLELGGGYDQIGSMSDSVVSTLEADSMLVVESSGLWLSFNLPTHLGVQSSDSCAQYVDSAPAIWGLPSVVYGTAGVQTPVFPFSSNGSVAYSLAFADNDTIAGAWELSADNDGISVTPGSSGVTTMTVVVGDGYKEAAQMFVLSVNSSAPLCEVTWASNFSAVEETDGTVDLVLERSGADLSGRTSVVVSTLDGDGSATVALDYVSINAQLVEWAPHETDGKAVTLTLVDDNSFEADDETVLLGFEAVSGALEGALTRTTVSIAGPSDVGADPEDLGPQIESVVVSDFENAFDVTFDREVFCNWTVCDACEVEWLLTTDTLASFDAVNCSWTADDTVTVAHSPEDDLSGLTLVELRSGWLYSSATGAYSSDGSFAEVEPRTPAPEVSGAVFGNSGAYIYVSFDATTTTSTVTQSSSTCDGLFGNPSDLGAATCQWTSPTRLRIALGAGATIEPGTCALTVLGGTFRPLTNSVVSTAAGCVDVDAPAVPPRPVVVWNAPSEIGNCDGVVLDVSGSTGGAGRDMTSVTWAVVALNDEAAPTVANITAALDAYGQQTVMELAHALLPIHGEWQFTVTMTNFLSSTATVSTHTLAKKATASPLVSVTGGGEQRTLRYVTLSLRATARVSACSSPEADGGEVLDFEWEALDDGITLDASEDPREATVAPYALDAERAYGFRVTALRRANPLQNASATVSVWVDSSPVVARVRGGDRIGVATSQAVLLSAAEDREFQDGTVDPDRLDDVPFSYRWSTGETGEELLIPAASMAAGSHVFTVNATKEERWSTASVTVTYVDLAEADVVAVDLRARSPRAKFSPSEPITLLGNATSVSTGEAVNATWSLSASTSTTDLDLSAYVTTPLDRPYIVVAADTLSPGVSYTFRLTAGITTAELVIETNSPPTSGSLSVSPLEGTALETEFALKATGWTDDAEDLPLKYFFVDLSAAFSAGNTLTTTLPPGNVTVVALVSDVLGAVQESAGVDVLVAELAYAAVGNATATLFDAARDTRDGEAAFNVGAAVAGVLAGLAQEPSADPGEWSAWGACSVSCGGGTQTRTQSVTLEEQTQACNVGACSVLGVDGGFSDWSAWAACDCDGGGGTTTRERSCTNPTPTPDGAPCEGDTTETEDCRAECPRSCPSDCSGHGACLIEPSDCTLADALCESLECECEAGWSGAACSYDDASFADVVATREYVLLELESAGALMSSSASVLLQAQALAELTVNPDQLSPASTNATMNLVGAMLAANGAVSPAAGAALAETLSSVALSGSSSSAALGVQNATETLVRALVSDSYPGVEPSELVTDAFAASAVRDSLSLLDSLDATDALGFTTTLSLQGLTDASVSTQGSSLGQVVQVFDDADLGVIAWSVDVSNRGIARSTTVELTDPADDSQIEVEGLDSPLLLRSPLALISDAATATCRYWDADAQAWETRGMVLVGVTDDGMLLCETTHLTDFASTAESFVPEANTVDPVGDAGLLAAYGDAENFLVLGVLAFLFLSFAGLGTYFHLKDKDLRKRMTETARELFIKDGKPLVVPHIDASDVRKTYPQQLQAKHAYVGLMKPSPHLHAALSRAERCFVLLSAIMVGLAVSATFFGKENVGISQRVGMQLIVVLCMLPPTAIFPGLLMSFNVPSSSSTTPAPQNADVAFYQRLAHRNKTQGKESALSALSRLRDGAGLTSLFRRVQSAVPVPAAAKGRGKDSAKVAAAPDIETGVTKPNLGIADAARAHIPNTPAAAPGTDDVLVTPLPWYHGEMRRLRLPAMLSLVLATVFSVVGVVGFGLAALLFPFASGRALGLAGACVVIIVCSGASVHLLGSLKRNSTRKLPPRLILIALLVAAPAVLVGSNNPLSGNPAALTDMLAGQWRSGDADEACAAWEAENDCCGWSDPLDHAVSDSCSAAAAGCEASVVDDFESRELVPGLCLCLAWLALLPPLALALLVARRPEQFPVARKSPLLSSRLAGRLVRLLTPMYVEWRDEQRARRAAEADTWKDLRASRQQMRLVTYACMAMLTLIATYMCLIFGIKFGSETARQWLFASLTSVSIDVLVSQPIKCLVVALVVDTVHTFVDVLVLVSRGALVH